MRFSTAQIHQQALESMLLQQARLNKTQQQISLGKRVITAADDPVQSANLLQLKQRI